MKKMLFFYPDNPLILNQGNNARANALLQYFKSRNFSVDIVGERHKEELFTLNDIEILKQKKLINRGFLIPKRKNKGLKYLLGTSIPNKITKFPRQFQRVSSNQTDAFKKILKQNTYDYIIISYVLFAPFIEDRKLTKNAKIIVDTHDFFTSQFYNTFKKNNVGRLFKTEINLLNKFDVLWSISPDEHFIFSQFLPQKEILTIPHGVKNKSADKKPNSTIDIFYVASNNPHNLNAAKWFFDKVYPLLPKNIQITVVGRVNQVIPDLPNVTKVTFAEDLKDYYEKTKITICPMLTGTGLKIKVVESLSYGIPVVCNERGVDGLSSKINNGCLVSNNPKEFSNYIIELLNNELIYKQQVDNAKEFFSKTLDENIVLEKLDGFFDIKSKA